MTLCQCSPAQLRRCHSCWLSEVEAAETLEWTGSTQLKQLTRIADVFPSQNPDLVSVRRMCRDSCLMSLAYKMDQATRNCCFFFFFAHVFISFFSKLWSRRPGSQWKIFTFALSVNQNEKLKFLLKKIQNTHLQTFPGLISTFLDRNDKNWSQSSGLRLAQKRILKSRLPYFKCVR